jgi:cysteinyl-tRNA synthetase
MVLALYGPSVDIHCGGADLAYPHHACETALAEAATGVTPFARSWMRAGIVSVNGAKMAKSTGNLVLVGDLLKEHSAAAVRLLILDRRWDQDWDFSPAALDAAAARLERLQAAAGRPGGSGTAAVAATRQALASDLDVPAALRIAESEGAQAARSLGALLGLW